MTLAISPPMSGFAGGVAVLPIHDTKINQDDQTIGLAILDPGGKHCREHWRVVVLSAPHASKWWYLDGRRFPSLEHIKNAEAVS